MLPLVLVAASGLAREVAEAVRRCGEHRLVGVLDDDGDRWGERVGGATLTGPIAAPVLNALAGDASLLLCAGKGASREALVRRLEREGIGRERYATVIDAAAVMPVSGVVGVGCVVLAGVVATADVQLGDHVVVMPGAVLTHDDVLEDFATVCAGVMLAGDVHVGRGAYLGTGASVRQGCSIGPGATVGMGAVVLRDVPAGEVWVGNPARPLERGARA